MNIQNIHHRNLYWRRARRITFTLVALWFFSTFGIIFFARELSGFTVFGWPLSFYMAAQGLTLLYLVIVAAYAVHMRRLDRMLKNEAADAK